MLYNISIGPTSMRVVKDAIDLFGIDRVNPGEWLGPVYVNDLSYEEVAFAIEFFDELGIAVKIESKV